MLESNDVAFLGPFCRPRAAAFIKARLCATGGAGLQVRDPEGFSSSTSTTIHTPICPLIPISGVQWIHRLRPSSFGLESHRTLAVTPRPSAKAEVSSSRTRGDPPILSRNGDCRMPGTRCEGEANRIRSAGYGRTSRYCRDG